MTESATTGTEAAPEGGTGHPAGEPPPGAPPAAPGDEPVPAAGDGSGDAAATGSDPGPTPPAGRMPGRMLRALGRWTAAAAAFGLAGTGVAYGITQAERGDLPGLATKSDGRWDYPQLELPALPPGAPEPYAPRNHRRVHHADVRDLLLPAPQNAVGHDAVPALTGEWVTASEFAALFVSPDRHAVEQRLADDAVRHIAARGWEMPDGTRTSVYLLRFNSALYADAFLEEELTDGVSPVVEVVGAANAGFDEDWPQAAALLDRTIRVHSFDELEPRGERHVRQAYLAAGDTLAVVVQSRKGKAAAVPFQQTVLLQARLLR